MFLAVLHFHIHTIFKTESAGVKKHAKAQAAANMRQRFLGFQKNVLHALTFIISDPRYLVRQQWKTQFDIADNKSRTHCVQTCTDAHAPPKTTTERTSVVVSL